MYRAVSSDGGPPVAVKVLSFELSKDLEYLKRFRREIKAGSSISSPNVVKVIEWGEQDGCHYFVMELLSGGRDLSEVLKEEGPFSNEDVISIGIGLCAALEALHDNSVVHRDIKPGNIMLLPDGSVKLMDLGLARILDRTALTVTGEALGSPRYMAPEILTGKVADFRSDVYQVGVLLYELLAGEPAFDSENFERLLHLIVESPPEDIRTKAPYVSEPLACAIEKCLKKNPKDRFRSVKDLREHFEAINSGALGEHEPSSSGDDVESEGSLAKSDGSSHVESGAVKSSGNSKSGRLRSSSSFPRNTDAPVFHGKRLLVFSVLLFVGVLCCVVRYLATPGIPPVEPDISIVQGLRAVEVTWKTSIPSPTIAKIADSLSQVQSYKNEAEEEAVSHKIMLTNLREGETYRLKLYGVPREFLKDITFTRVKIPVAEDFQVNRNGKLLTVSGFLPVLIKPSLTAIVSGEEFTGYDKSKIGGISNSSGGGNVVVGEDDSGQGYSQRLLQINGIPPYNDISRLQMTLRDSFGDVSQIQFKAPPGTVSLLKASAIDSVPLPSAVQAFVKESNLFFADISCSYSLKKQVYDLLLSAGVNDSLLAPFVRWSVIKDPSQTQGKEILPVSAELPATLIPHPFAEVSPLESINDLKNGRLYIFRLDKAVQSQQIVSLILKRSGIGEGARLRLLIGEDFQIIDKEHFRNNITSKVSFSGECLTGRKLIIVRVIAESLSYNNEDAEHMILDEIRLVLE